MKRWGLIGAAGVAATVLLLLLFADAWLSALGRWLVVSDPWASVEAVVVLNAGVEYYPRVVEAASLYRRGRVRWVVINGNRKTEMLRQLEREGFERCCTWYEDALRILRLYGVPEDRVITLSVEDAYDTVSEARAVGEALIRQGVRRVLIATSKFHTRRARFVWRKMYEGRLSVGAVPAGPDPFDPASWWQDGRQVRWVLAEYGAWLYLWWKAWGQEWLEGERA